MYMCGRLKGILVCDRCVEDKRSFSMWKIKRNKKLLQTVKGPVKYRNIHTGGSGVSDISRSLDLNKNMIWWNDPNTIMSKLI